MRFLSHFRLTPAFSLVLIFVVGLALLGPTRSTTYAAGTPSKVSAKSKLTPAAPASNCGAWSVVSSPNPGTNYDILNGVAALTSSNAWAVGSYENNLGVLQTLIEHWDGTNWNVVPSPNIGTGNNVLNGVTALSTKNIWAVGYYNNNQQTLIEHWDGTNWNVIPSPNMGMNSNVLNAVTRIPGSNHLWAVGYYWNTGNTYQTLIELWDGTQWSIVPNPSIRKGDNLLNGVTALSTSDVWAVGTTNNIRAGIEKTLVVHWNGTAWSVVPSPNLAGNGYLHAVTRVPRTSKLWTTGFYNNTSTSYETLTEYGKGKQWKIVFSPNPGPEGSDTVINLLGVTALSASNVWAVGYYQYSNGMSPTQTLAEFWDGIQWNIVSSPNPGTGSILSAVTRVPGSSYLWAVGETENFGVGYQTLIESYC